MRFLFALLSIASLAAAAVPAEYDNVDDFDISGGGGSSRSDLFSHATTGQKEYSFGQEMAMGFKALSKFDQAKVAADRISRYEVNPNFDFNGVRSLDLKMTPILNFQKSNVASVPSTSMGMSKGRKMMMKLLNLGIKPHTVKKFLFLKKQGIIGVVENPVTLMLQIQKEDDTNTIGEMPIRSAWLGSTSNEFSMPTLAATREVEHGVVIPSLSFANNLREVGVIVSTTVTGQPAIEIKHLQDSLLQCETLEWKTSSCVRLRQLAVNLLGEQETLTSTGLHSSIVGLTMDPQIMRTIHTENIMQ